MQEPQQGHQRDLRRRDQQRDGTSGNTVLTASFIRTIAWAPMTDSSTVITVVGIEITSDVAGLCPMFK
jgi:hypothetical protein